MLITKEKAIQNLKDGQIVAIPTETVYGLAARFDNPEAVESIFTTKERPFFDPLICHISDKAMLGDLVETISPITQKLMDTYWPGPLTLVLPKKKSVSDVITSGLETVAVRMPSHPIALDIIRSVGVALCAPSANKFGKTSPTTGKHVEAEFEGKVAIVDGGESTIGIESTVVRVTGNKLEILRPGRITASELQVLLPQTDVVVVKKDTASPGHIDHHYQPEKPFFLISEKKLRAFLLADKYTEWKLDDNPLLAARKLYSDMREISNTSEGFYCVKKENQNHGLWEAIWNRLEKASFHKDLL